jgi:hypothetical protein
MRKTLSTSILLLALSGSAYAGNIPTDSPTPPQTATATTTETGSDPLNAQPSEPTTTDVAVNLLQTVLAIL